MKSLKLLITGGAGYIGSHMVKHAQDQDHEVTVLDDFSTGHEWALKNCEIINVNLLDKDRLSKALSGRYFDGVIHFAAKSLVAESIQNPFLYYQNNVTGTLNLLNEMIINDINNIVFSSTAAIFGNPVKSKILENHPKFPINAYGKSKLIIEGILDDISRTHNINVICFRYFNAAGAHESGKIGEAHDPETHLIPNILNSLLKNNISLKVFGNDYPTKDGTCIRDYIHVSDLAHAHLLGIQFIQNNKGFFEFNLGNGQGYSILDIIDSCNDVTGIKLGYEFASRRPGDPAILVADSSLAKSVLGWEPKFSEISEIVSSAWNWHKK